MNHEPTIENLATELKKRHYKTELCDKFIKAAKTPQSPKTRLMACGLQMWFNKRVVVCNETEKYFYIAFEG